VGGVEPMSGPRLITVSETARFCVPVGATGRQVSEIGCNYPATILLSALGRFADLGVAQTSVALDSGVGSTAGAAPRHKTFGKPSAPSHANADSKVCPKAILYRLSAKP
jgi:hypothetical protein